MKVIFIIWYDTTTPQIVDVLNSILPSAGPVRISILAVKTSVGRQLEDSAVRWTPGCRVIYTPGASKKLAWEHGINSVCASGELQGSNYVVLCDPYFIAKTKIFNEDYYEHNYRFYIPYSDQYGEKSAERTNKLVKMNGGGSMLMLSRAACYNFKTFPAFLEKYCLDYFIFDQLGLYGYTAHKMPGCYISSIKKEPPTDKERKLLSNDLSCYDAWLSSKERGGYNRIIEKQMSMLKEPEQNYFCSEENCD